MLPPKDSKAQYLLRIICPGLHAAAKIAICRMLWNIVSLTIFRASCDISQFFVKLIFTEVQSELPIQQNLRKLQKKRKSHDFLCYLRFLAVLCHVNQLTFFCEKFPLYLPFWHFPVSALKAYLHAKASAANL